MLIDGRHQLLQGLRPEQLGLIGDVAFGLETVMGVGRLERRGHLAIRRLNYSLDLKLDLIGVFRCLFTCIVAIVH